jgi:hypothetical protein
MGGLKLATRNSPHPIRIPAGLSRFRACAFLVTSKNDSLTKHQAIGCHKTIAYSILTRRGSLVTPKLLELCGI